MGQIYSSYIKLNDKLLEYVLSVRYDREIYPKLETYQIKILEGNSVRLDLTQFHILMALTKNQNHVLNMLTDDFFESLSQFKDRLTMRFSISCNPDDNTLTPIAVEYHCQSNKTNIKLKKTLIKRFSDFDLHIKEVKRKHEYPITQFIFQ